MRWSWMIAAALLVGPALAVRADIPPPPPPPKPSTPAKFVVEIDPNARDPRLIVPRKIVVRRADLDRPGEDHLTDADEPRQPWTRTVLAGISLALGASCAGLWLARRSNRKALAILLVAGGVVGGTAVAWADLRPPQPRPRPQPPIALEQFYSGKIDVEYVAEADTIKLILPTELARKWTKVEGEKAPGAAPARRQ